MFNNLLEHNLAETASAVFPQSGCVCAEKNCIFFPKFSNIFHFFQKRTHQIL